MAKKEDLQQQQQPDPSDFDYPPPGAGPNPDTPSPDVQDGETVVAPQGGVPVVEMEDTTVKVKQTTESLKCILTDDEIRRYGVAQARANADIGTAEDELQSIKSQFKSRIDAATAKRNDMAQRINNGYEFRPVECEVT